MSPEVFRSQDALGGGESFSLGRNLMYQPLCEVLCCFIVVKFRRKLSSINVFVIQPWIAKGKNGALAKLCNCHNHVALVLENGFCRRRKRDCGNLFEVKPFGRFEDGVLIGSHNQPHSKSFPGTRFMLSLLN